MATRIENFDVYVLADFFSNEIWDIVTLWDYFAKDTIGKQLIRLADSISGKYCRGV